MVFSYYITKPFYIMIWHTIKLFRKRPRAILYCNDILDIELYKNIGIYLKPIEIVAKSNTLKRKLISQGYTNISTLPSFPDYVIMFRNMAWRFPCKKIIKIGLEHHAYNFKRHSSANYYNMFTVFFVTSNEQIKILREMNVTTELLVAYPKIDSLFNGSITPEYLLQLSHKARIDSNKKTLLFSSTWDKSGMSAIDKWYDKISLLKDKYNVIVTLHDWMNEEYKRVLQENPDIFYIDDLDRLPYIKLADICVSDTSSFIAECILLNKPLITFKTAIAKRTIPEVIKLIESISIQINSFEELENAIIRYIEQPDLLKNSREKAIKQMFDAPDGQAGKRVADKIIEIVPSLKPHSLKE